MTENYQRKARDLRPILVTGSHRSGTTWAGRMIDSAGQTVYISEPFNPHVQQTGLCTAKFRGFTYIDSENEGYYLEPISRMLSYSYDLQTAIRTVRSLAGMKRRLGELRRTARGKRQRLRPLMKDPIAIFSAEWLARQFEMDMLVMIRHPAAFVSSVVRVGWTHNFGDLLAQPALMCDHLDAYRAEVEEFATREMSVLDQAGLIWKLMHHVIAGYRTRNPNWIFIKHEDLSERPLAKFEQIFEGLSLDFNDAARSTVSSFSSRTNDIEAPDGKGTHLRRDSASLVDAWRARLSKSEVRRIREIVEPVSSLFYDNDTWP